MVEQFPARSAIMPLADGNFFVNLESRPFAPAMASPTVLIQDTSNASSSSSRWLQFDGLHKVWSGHRLDQVVPALKAAEAWADRGGWSVGFLTYEAGPALDPALVTRAHPKDDLPLFWWAAFRHAREVQLPTDARLVDHPWVPTVDEQGYGRAIREIRAWIEAGETYQVNFTFPLKARFEQEPRAFFEALTAAQAASYGGYFELEDHVVASASPELFFRLDGDQIIARPMKGTSRRGRYPAEDAQRAGELHSEKNRAENLMILDMMRNDLGRVARPGTVRVSKLFETETYPTVHQLISEVEARTESSRLDILRALFPCASITGAPKIRTTQLIAGLEAEPRGLYTGAFGYFGPNRTAQMSVAIRTAVIDRRRRTATYGTGGGIVWDSRADEEYRECRTKALVLSRRPQRFELLESILWRRHSGYFLLRRHLDRLLASADFFGRPADRQTLVAALEALALKLEEEAAGPGHHVGHQVKVRLLVDPEGLPRVEAIPLRAGPRKTWTAALDDRPVDADNVFLFHKTTQRQVYDSARARHPEADEVLLWNGDQRLTESTIGNLVLRFGNRFLTPPVAAGLLAGTFRAALLDRGRIHEADLHRSALAEADQVFVISSIRGWIPIEGTFTEKRCQPSYGSFNESGTDSAFVSES